MKLVITTDLHQRIAKWNDLVPVVETERPRFVLIAGDLLPKDTFKQQKAFFAEMRRLFQALKQHLWARASLRDAVPLDRLAEPWNSGAVAIPYQSA